MGDETRGFTCLAMARIEAGRSVVAFAPSRADVEPLQAVAAMAGREAAYLRLATGARHPALGLAGHAVLDLSSSFRPEHVGEFLADVTNFRFADRRAAWRAAVARFVDAAVEVHVALGLGRPGLDDIERLGIGDLAEMATRAAASGQGCPKAGVFFRALGDMEGLWETRAGSEIRRTRLHWGSDTLDAFRDDGRPRVSVPDVVAGRQVLLMSGDGPEARRCVRIVLGALAREAATAGLQHPGVVLHRGSASRSEGPYASLHAEAHGLSQVKVGHTLALVAPQEERRTRATLDDAIPAVAGLPSPDVAIRRMPGGDAMATGAGGATAVLWSGTEPGLGMAFDVDRNGWCVASELWSRDGGRMPSEARAALASGVRSGRLSLLDGSAGFGVRAERMAPSAVVALAGPGCAAWARAESAAEMASLIDLPLVSACLSLPEPAASHLAAISFPGRGRRDFIVSWQSFGRLFREPAVDAAIRSGGKTLPVVAALLGTDLARARRLVGRRGLPPSWARALAELRRRGRMDGGLPYLAAFGPDALPPRRDAAAWESFCTCVAALDALVEGLHAGRLPDGLGARLLRASGRDWAGRAARIGDDPVRHENAADMVRSLVRLLRNVPDTPCDAMSVVAAVGVRGGLAEVAACSDRWHAHPVLPRVDGGGASPLPDDASWPPLFEGEVSIGDGWAARCLSDVASLADEGSKGTDRDGERGMDHCVATYAMSAAEGRCHIVSLRHHGARATTAEIVPHADGDHPVGEGRLHVAQHRARRNGVPSAEAGLRLGALMAALSEGSLPHVPDALRTRPAPVAVPDAPAADPAEILEMWQPVLPRHLRDRDLDRLAEAVAAHAP